MSQIIPIYIPTLISDVNYNPTKVYPRLFFYNGLVNCEPYWFQYKTASGSAQIDNIEVNAFPYVDHYNVVSGSFPTGNSKSLLFQNETPVYGATPTGSLYSDYWQTYINLLYDPKTRLINCSGIIPLADYFKMELNDIVEWRGNYYHLRAINEYNLATGDCQLQLLGPIIKDTFTAGIDCSFDFSISDVTTTTTTTTQAPGPTTTTTQGPVACFSYQYGPAQSGCNIQWVNCDGSNGTTFVAVGQYYTVPCMREGSGTGCGQWTKGASCGVTTTTTSTTLPPTTTTTTLACTKYVLRCTSGNGCNGGTYIDCNGATTGINYTPSNSIREICASYYDCGAPDGYTCITGTGVPC